MVNRSIEKQLHRLEENIGLTIEQLSLMNMFSLYGDELIKQVENEDYNLDHFPRCIREFLLAHDIAASRRSRFNLKKLKEILPSLQNGSYWQKERK